MRNAAIVVLIVFLIGYANAQDVKLKLDDLKWIAGCWEIDRPERKQLISEQWMSPNGGAMIGMSRTVRNGTMGGFEFLRIVETSAGIHYISKPSENKEETAFKLVKSAPGAVTFENPAHDFPQRIIYKQTKPDTLSARIEGAMNGQSRGIDFSFTRAKCS